MIRATDEPTAVVLDVDQAALALNPTRTRVSRTHRALDAR
jgi:hypothetical protein